MRIAFFSPLPPSRSGIADYSAALLDSLRRIADVEPFAAATDYQARDFDIAVYQIGNNSCHIDAYEQALRNPGVVVLHEANLHHLITDLTIRRDDWDGYLRELEYDGGAQALEHGRRVRALEVGPDYDGVPMLRRILERARGVIVHSRCVETEVRNAGFTGPVAVIPHGAWIPEADGWAFRQRLGVGPRDILLGIFGFLKPYKRIAQSLRAFQRLVRVMPAAKMILVGEPHPELSLPNLIAALDLESNVRTLGFTPIDDFVGYIAACDVVLNLRFPTVGESSGTLLRSLGLGKAVVVSDIGSFREYPDEICLKVPVDSSEEDVLFGYMNLLASRADLRLALGQHARDWVQAECTWDVVAERYLEFLRAVAQGADWKQPARSSAASPASQISHVQSEPVDPAYLRSWSVTESGKSYLQQHLTRFEKTLQITPPGTASHRILEMGAYMQITPSLKTRLGYGEVRGCYFGKLGVTERREVTSESGETFACDIDLFDAEKDRFPYPDGYFHTVLCCELIEHLPTDPMHMMSEINRILAPQGVLVLTTPNIVSLRAISAILQGYHPGFFPAYLRPSAVSTDARHNREYAPREISALLRDAGFMTVLLESGPFIHQPSPELEWVVHLLQQYKLPLELRGDGLYAVGRKAGPVRDRFPAWLYS